MLKDVREKLNKLAEVRTQFFSFVFSPFFPFKLAENHLSFLLLFVILELLPITALDTRTKEPMPKSSSKIIPVFWPAYPLDYFVVFFIDSTDLGVLLAGGLHSE